MQYLLNYNFKKIFFSLKNNLIILTALNLFVSSCSQYQDIDQQIKKIGFPINQKVNGTIKIARVHYNKASEDGPDEITMLLTKDKFEARVERLNFNIYWTILYWDKNEFVAYHPPQGIDYKYFCKVDARQIICNFNRYEYEYNSIYTYTLIN